MEVIIGTQARQNMYNIFSYNSKYSIKNAIQTNAGIKKCINNLASFPFIGRTIPEIYDKRFREVIYKKSRKSGYRIMYYILPKNNTIFVFNIIHTKQDFSQNLKFNNYFNNFPNKFKP